MKIKYKVYILWLVFNSSLKWNLKLVLQPTASLFPQAGLEMGMAIVVFDSMAYCHGWELYFPC